MKGKRVIITGGAGVLGSALARGAVKAGARVALLGRTRAKLDERVAELERNGGEAMALEADVLDRRSLEEARSSILREWSGIDVLINGAGGNKKGATIMPDQDFWNLAMTDFSDVADLNLKGTVLPTMVFGEEMARHQKGCIINISSMAAQQALTRVLGYSAAKAAVDNFTRWLAVDVAQKYGEGMRVNAIAPGFFVADQNRALLLNPDGTYTDRGNTIIRNTPMARFGSPDELVSTMEWLCDDRSSFITGIVVPVDGGFSAFSGV
ncbi:MAG: SDR family oxidoreductase [Saprospiraceae bacterium]|nr:SDR family oxidoreductase [Saprospiraceae bacterium]